MLRLSHTLGLVEITLSRASRWKSLMISSNVLLKRGIVEALLPIGLKIIWSTGHLAFKAVSWLPLLRIGDGSEEVAGCLTSRTLPPHVDEVVSRGIAWTEEDFSSLIQDYHLIKDIVDCLGSLIDCDRMA